MKPVRRPLCGRGACAAGAGASGRGPVLVQQLPADCALIFADRRRGGYGRPDVLPLSAVPDFADAAIRAIIWNENTEECGVPPADHCFPLCRIYLSGSQVVI